MSDSDEPYMPDEPGQSESTQGPYADGMDIEPPSLLSYEHTIPTPVKIIPPIPISDIKQENMTPSGPGNLPLPTTGLQIFLFLRKVIIIREDPSVDPAILDYRLQQEYDEIALVDKVVYERVAAKRNNLFHGVHDKRRITEIRYSDIG